MKQYLVAIYNPDDYDPSTEGQAMPRDIDACNGEMMPARVRIFVGGLSPARSAPETKEHLGGFWVLEAADLDEAVAWGAQGCRRLSGAGRGTPDNGQRTRPKQGNHVRL